MANFSEEAKQILESRYLKKDKEGNVIETPDEMLDRVASHIASAEKEEDRKKWHKKFLEIMDSLEFLPNSPTLMNAGKELGQLSACFCVAVEDDLNSIFEAIKESAWIHKSGGGCGANFSKLRGYGSIVGSTKGVASGPVSFISVFNAATETVKQGGCFIGDTFVATASGPKKIKDIKEGDLVYSWDGRYKLSHCTSSWKTKENAEVWKLETDKGLVVYATPDHPFLTRCGKHGVKKDFVKLRDLKIGMPLMPLTKNHKVISIGFSHFEDVYNVEVPEIHNFVVCTQDMKGGVVVSNTRRGANMGILNIDHPDIFDFVRSKRDTSKLQNFNLSIGMDGKFLALAKNNQKHILVDPHSKKKISINSTELMQEICHSIWGNGEPGIIFLDTINKMNPIPWFGKIESTNPCGEQPLLVWESCNLGSIDVSKFVSSDREIDWNKLTKTIEIAIRFLDDVIDVNKYPRVKIARKTLATRKIGLGIMGWADLLLKMQVKYDSQEALNIAEQLMSMINNNAHRVSEKIGKEKGFCPAGNGKIKRRNATITTIAPTGTLSMLANCSSSIEPIFSRNFTKKVLGNIKVNLSKKYKEEGGDYFVTALEISPEWHVRMQAAFQKYVDNAVSKTVNLPFDAKVEEVRDAIYLAYDLGCKGLTLYRNGTREAPIEISIEGLSECENGKCAI